MDEARKLETEFARWLGVGHAVGAGFGRSALRLALAAAGTQGREVLAPDFICAQVTQAVRAAGAQPMFYSLQRDLSVKPGDLAAAITRKTCAAIVPHYFGRVLPQVEDLRQVCRERGLLLIEDCALALGAEHGGRRAGTFGDISVFSFTKSDWCYGGGIAATNSADLARSMRDVLDSEFVTTRGLAGRYGRLRQTDFLTNRPRYARTAEVTGRRLERQAGIVDFYEAGRFDERMGALAARRARQILNVLPATKPLRRRTVAHIVAALSAEKHILLRPELNEGDTAAFLVLKSSLGRAHAWREEAARLNVTLRLTWPAYQAPEPACKGGHAPWMADHLLVLEVHPRLSTRETEKIAGCLLNLARKEG